jgi:hypothetical protein
MSIFQSHADKARKPLLGEGVRPLSDFFSDTMIVQDYPEKYVMPPLHQPRLHHDSYFKAKREGYLYGMLTSNNGKHWTRCLFFKPSALLEQKWDEIAGGSKIESFSIESLPNSSLMVISVTYMNHIGNKVIGFITENDYKQMQMATWSKDLGEAI